MGIGFILNRARRQVVIITVAHNRPICGQNIIHAATETKIIARVTWMAPTKRGISATIAPAKGIVGNRTLRREMFIVIKHRLAAGIPAPITVLLNSFRYIIYDIVGMA
jgi:hypothetical protein